VGFEEMDNGILLWNLHRSMLSINIYNFEPGFYTDYLFPNHSWDSMLKDT